MAKDLKAKEPEVVEVVDAPPPPPKSFRLQILLGMVVLVLFQVGILCMLLPSRAVVQSDLGIDPVTGTGDYENPKALATQVGKKDEMVEKSIGEKAFKVKDLQQDGVTTDTFTVSIHIKILKKDESAYDKRYSECQFEIQDAVTTVLRAASRHDKQEFSLTLIKQKVMKATNDVLGTPYVREVLCSEPTLESQ